MNGTRSARRLVEDTGAAETAAFVGEPGHARFLYMHHPPVPPRMGILVCPPLLGDFTANYRREVVFAREMAARGVEVWRFHFPGTGNSDGSWLDMSLTTLRDAALETARHMADTLGDLPIGVVGTRMSAPIAAACVAGQPADAPLILWDPVVHPKKHYKQAFRAESMRNLKEKRADAPSVSEMMTRMAETGAVDLLGYSLPHALYQEAIDLDLVRTLEGRPRPVLVASMGNHPADVETLVATLRQDGFAVHDTVVEDDESWWFDQDRLDAGPLVQATVAWLSGEEGLRAAD